MYCIYELIIKIMLHHGVCVIMHNYIITLIQFCQITHSVIIESIGFISRSLHAES